MSAWREGARWTPGHLFSWFSRLGIVLVGLGIVAMGLTLVAAGYGFAGWATIAGIVCAALFLSGAAVIFAEWRRRRGEQQPDPEVRQGH